MLTIIMGCWLFRYISNLKAEFLEPKTRRDPSYPKGCRRIIRASWGFLLDPMEGLDGAFNSPVADPCLAGNGGMKAKMETTILGYIRTTIRIHSFIPSYRRFMLSEAPEYAEWPNKLRLLHNPCLLGWPFPYLGCCELRNLNQMTIICVHTSEKWNLFIIISQFKFLNNSPDTC